jgi:hypothetical protein
VVVEQGAAEVGAAEEGRVEEGAVDAAELRKALLLEALKVFYTDGEWQAMVHMLQVAFGYKLRFSWVAGEYWQNYCYVEVTTGELGPRLDYKGVKGKIKTTPQVPPITRKGLGPELGAPALKKPFGWRTDWSGTVPCSENFMVIGNKSFPEAVGAGVIYALLTKFRGRLHEVVGPLTVEDLYGRCGEAQLYRPMANAPLATIAPRHADAAISLMKALAQFISSPEHGEGQQVEELQHGEGQQVEELQQGEEGEGEEVQQQREEQQLGEEEEQGAALEPPPGPAEGGG